MGPQKKRGEHHNLLTDWWLCFTLHVQSSVFFSLTLFTVIDHYRMLEFQVLKTVLKIVVMVAHPKCILCFSLLLPTETILPMMWSAMSVCMRTIFGEKPLSFRLRAHTHTLDSFQFQFQWFFFLKSHLITHEIWPRTKSNPNISITWMII